MKANQFLNGKIIIEFDSRCESILSPDKKLQFLPCKTCGEMEWKGRGAVSFLCDICFENNGASIGI